jgi:acetylornithine deacetylase/succinyl-diaminopimelate desuccinylase family protein
MILNPGDQMKIARVPESHETIGALPILEELVKRQSHRNEAEVVDYLAGRFSSLGVDFRVRELHESGRANVVATYGEGGRSLIFNSHMDTVAPGDESEWTHPPFAAMTREGRLFGRGAADAKGSLAAMIAAFEALVRSKTDLGGTLTLMAVAYEEASGLGTQAEVSAGARADAAVIGEPTGLEVHLAHKGVLRFEVATKGIAAHASEPWEGQNAITAMGRLLGGIEKLSRDIEGREDPRLGRATLAVTLIDGGIGRNIIPPRCVIQMDRRLLPAEDPEAARREVTERIERLCREDPRITAVLERVSLAESSQISPKEPIVQVALETRSQLLGLSSEAGGFPACCDMAYLRNQGGIPTIILGPGSLDQAHKIDESIEVAELEQAALLYRQLALNWFESPHAMPENE